MLKDFLEEVALKNEGNWLIYDLLATWPWSSHIFLRGSVSLSVKWENITDKCFEDYKVP